MRLASVLTPLSDENLRLAAQCGVTDVVDRYPGPALADFQRLKARVESFGLRLAVIEGFAPMDNLIFGRDDGTELAAMKNLLRHTRVAGVLKKTRSTNRPGDIIASPISTSTPSPIRIWRTSWSTRICPSQP